MRVDSLTSNYSNFSCSLLLFPIMLPVYSLSALYRIVGFFFLSIARSRLYFCVLICCFDILCSSRQSRFLTPGLSSLKPAPPGSTRLTPPPALPAETLLTRPRGFQVCLQAACYAGRRPSATALRHTSVCDRPRDPTTTSNLGDCRVTPQIRWFGDALTAGNHV